MTQEQSNVSPTLPPPSNIVDISILGRPLPQFVRVDLWAPESTFYPFSLSLFLSSFDPSSPFLPPSSLFCPAGCKQACKRLCLAEKKGEEREKER